MTKRILALLRRAPERVLTRQERELELMRYRVRLLGDRVREMNAWKRGYSLRTGRAA
jgi:hypothetical protein